MDTKDRAAKLHNGALARLVCLLKMSHGGILSGRFQFSVTILTMAVGAFTLSLTFFLGDGARLHMWRDMEQLMGSWAIATGTAHLDSRLLKERLSPDFTPQDLDFVRGRLDGQARIVEPIFQSQVMVTYRNRSRTMAIDGITAPLAREALFMPEEGRSLSADAHQSMIWECMLTKSAGRVLGVDIGQDANIIIDGRFFRIVGITPDPPDADDYFRPRITVPYDSARALWLPAQSVGEILVAWYSADRMNETVNRLRSALDDCRGADTYYLSSSEFKIQKSRSIVASFVRYGEMEALFCIIVAFVGVLNVMLTNTFRRSSEFAIRISMGATHRQLLATVLLESSLLGLIGGSIGIFISACIAPYAAGILQAKIDYASALTPAYGPNGILYPLLVCGLAGLIAGIVPALNVRRLDVLASLRN